VSLLILLSYVHLSKKDCQYAHLCLLIYWWIN